MKVLCDCWRKSETCIACYMANLEDWNQIHAIAMSAEAQRRLEEDLRFLESINVWHLVNLRSPPPPPPQNLYGYGDSLDIITPSTEHGSSYGSNPYHNHHQYHHPQHQQSHHHHAGDPAMYLQGNRYLPQTPTATTPNVADLNQQNNGHTRGQRVSSPGYGTSLPYPDLIIHARELSPPLPPAYFSQKPTDTAYLTVNGKQYEDVKKTPPIIKKHQNNLNIDYSNGNNREVDNNSPVNNNRSNALSSQNDKHSTSTWLAKEPEDYDAEEISSNVDDNDGSTEDAKKSVKFTPETIFVERDMDSPFWKAFTERRRLRRIHRQRKQLNAQITSASYQPSLVDIVKNAFTKSSSPTKDSNGNCTRRKQTKGEVLVYDNSSQVPESYTAQYVYSTTATTKRSTKFLQMITCQCCSAAPSS